ncbi:MAG TPA: hypothetical protein VM425_12135 [Myxococcota bacterium]|nr:hypothetical protein [Myxococcota bacterium]
MNAPVEIIALLEAKGARLEAVEDRLRLTAPPDTLQPEDRAELRQHKPEIIACLLDRDAWNAFEADRLLSAQGWVVVRCRALGGARVLWVLDGDCRVPPDAENLPRFTVAELERVVQHPGLLRATHAAKMFFPGSEVVR